MLSAEYHPELGVDRTQTYYQILPRSKIKVFNNKEIRQVK